MYTIQEKDGRGLLVVVGNVTAPTLDWIIYGEERRLADSDHIDKVTLSGRAGNVRSLSTVSLPDGRVRISYATAGYLAPILPLVTQLEEDGLHAYAECDVELVRERATEEYQTSMDAITFPLDERVAWRVNQ
jgi:hypothetical protein